MVVLDSELAAVMSVLFTPETSLEAERVRLMEEKVEETETVISKLSVVLLIAIEVFELTSDITV